MSALDQLFQSASVTRPDNLIQTRSRKSAKQEIENLVRDSSAVEVKSFFEKNIDPYDVYTSDEAFITGTPFCMLPVTSLNNLDIGDGKVGPIFSKLINLWSENTGIDIIKQITTWDLDNQVEEGDDVPTPYRFSKK